MADTCQEEPQARTAGFLQFRKTMLCPQFVKICSACIQHCENRDMVMKTSSRDVIFTEFHVENTPMAWKCFPARYTTRNTVRPWQRSWMKSPIFVRELPRITREQQAPRAVNKGAPSQHMREFTLFHLGCVPSWGHLWGIEDFTCPQSPKSVPRSCHSAPVSGSSAPLQWQDEASADEEK